MEFLQKFGDEFYLNFIKDNRWMYLVQGLKNKLLLTLMSVVLGIVLDCIVSLVRTTHDKTGKLKIANAICKV